MSCTSASASARSVFSRSAPRHGPRDLRDFQRMRQPVAKMIGEAHGEDLRLRFQPAESARMDHAVAVARVVVAVGMLRLRITPPPRRPHVHSIGIQRHRSHSISVALQARLRPGTATFECAGEVADPLELCFGLRGSLSLVFNETE